MSSSDALTRNQQNMNETPAVSVIIPAYNIAPYIGETLASVFAQSFTDYETIVVNDGSPDTLELERALEPYRERIVYLKQENSGPGGARNTGILEARGEYVAFLDGDDVWLPDYLSRQMSVLLGDTSLDLIYTDALLIGDSPQAGHTFMQKYPSRGAVTFESLLGWDCTVITSCVVARKAALIDAGMFDARFYYCEDFDLWLRLAHRGGRLDYRQQVLAHHRLHAASLCANEARQLEGEIAVYEKWLNEPTLSPEMKQLARAQMKHRRAELDMEQGKQKLLDGQYAHARESFARANDFFHRRKLSFTLVGLRIAPHLFRRLYDMRQQSLARKYKLKNTA
ncbi:MAG TPA: glycosyltransferase family A protein [Pyrinomonadaceae bacterium]|nr:glycosyltransferase family A protein [Pyrinomonadaceae bacterium]